MSAARVTASQLAGLPDMPADKSGVIRRATQAGWTFVEEPGRGGMRRLYHVDQLPAATRAALAWNQSHVVVAGQVPAAQAEQRALVGANAGRAEGARLALRGSLNRAASQAQQQTSLRRANELTPASQSRMDARLAVVRAFEAFSSSCGLPVHQARTAFALAYNDGAIEVPALVRDEVATTSDSSIERWQAALRKGGITALAGAYGNRAGSGSIDTQPALRAFVRAMLVQYPHARASHVMQAARARFLGADAAEPVTLPSMRTLERWMGDWREANAEVLQALANPDAWKNKHMVAFGSKSEGITELNQLWELDSSPADVLLEDGRYSLIGGIDVGTRWPVLIVRKTSTATAVAALVRRMLLELGVPERVKTDNGSDYKSNHIQRVFGALSLPGTAMQEFCPPFQPWHKPHIERFFGTFSRALVELAPGYIGHDVAERSAIEARKSFADRLMTRDATVELRMSAADLQSLCDRWVADVYMHNPHEGLGRRTPFEVAARGCAERRVIDDEHTLDILLAEAPGNGGRRTVQKKGISLDGTHFIAPELEAWVGREVQVRYDAVHHDLGTVFVFGETLDGEQTFICKAQAPERTGMDRREVASKAKAMQAARVQLQRKVMKAAAKKVGTDQVVDEILRERATAAGKLATLVPKRGTAHVTPGVSVAASAAAAATAPTRTTADIEQLQAVKAAQARIAAERVPTGTANDLAAQRVARSGGIRAPLFESVAERVDWLLRQARVRQLSAEEADALAQFRRTQPASYRRLAELVTEQLGAAFTEQERAPERVEGAAGAV